MFTFQRDIPCVGLGNTTWKKRAIAKGLEADECYYIANAQWAADREKIDLHTDPPPDLAIEVDITRSSLDKQAIYAALGVPELWRFENDRLMIVQLAGKTYKAVSVSPSLPSLPPEVVERFVRQRTSGKTDTQILSEFVEWVKTAG